MQTKIVSIVPYNPQTLTVKVNFLDGDTIVLEKTYPLLVDQSIETLYPQFKEDLNGLEAGKTLVVNLGPTLDKEIDLTNVKSSSEIQANQEAENSISQKEKIVIEAAPDDTTPLG